MRYLLLSVLVVCMIGIMIPSAFGDHGDKDYGMFSDQDEDEEHALIDKLPPGVIFPAPNFGDAINCPFKHYAGMNQYRLDAMGCVYEIFNIYQHLDFPQKEYIGVFENFALAENGIKLVKGNQKDLLVFYILIKNELNSPAGVLQEAFKMYDGRDRLFTTVTSTKLVFPQSVEVENTAFDWRETCPPFFFNEIQPGIEAKMKLCFEVPKDSDHFKMIYKKSISTSYEIDSNLILIIDRAFINRIGEKYEIGPITTTGTTTSTMQTADEVDTAVPSQTQTSGGCGPGTVLVNGVCQLAPTQSKSSFMSIEPIYLIIGAVAIGGAIAGIIAVAKRGSKTPKPARQELDEYEEQYLEKEKPARQIETSAFCDNCGKKLKPTAKFCGGCGNQV